MTESEAIQVVNQAAVKATTVVMMALRGMDVGPTWPNSKPDRAIVAEAWWTSPRKVLIQLECTRQVCRIAEL